MAPEFLVIEDDELCSRAIARILKKFGAVSIGRTAAEARTLIARGGWAALFLDVVLPDGNGLDVLAEARSAAFVTQTLVLTGFDTKDIVNRVFDLGAKLAVKPVDQQRIAAFASGVATRRPAAIDITVEVWRTRYGLTVAEIHILALAVDGLTHDQIAFTRHVSRQTLRSQVKALLAKTADDSLVRAALRLIREASVSSTAR